jgi:hypothetical protein
MQVWLGFWSWEIWNDTFRSGLVQKCCLSWRKARSFMYEQWFQLSQLCFLLLVQARPECALSGKRAAAVMGPEVSPAAVAGGKVCMSTWWVSINWNSLASLPVVACSWSWARVFSCVTCTQPAVYQEAADFVFVVILSAKASRAWQSAKVPADASYDGTGSEKWRKNQRVAARFVRAALLGENSSRIVDKVSILTCARLPLLRQRWRVCGLVVPCSRCASDCMWAKAGSGGVSPCPFFC